MAAPSKSEPKLRAFAAHLESVRREVDARLGHLFERTLADLAPHGDEVVRMAEAARDLTLRGGKRFRAGMVVAAFTGLAPRASIEPALAAAVSIELLQSYLLIQDDWMDDDPIRRGGPSAHVALAQAFGSAHAGACSALLASDLTWGLAVRALARARTKPERRLRAMEVLCDVHQDVVCGQQIDTLGRSKDVEAMHALKTGSYTARGPLLLGAALAAASKRAEAALARYAAPLGVAFQLRDDLLGAFASEADTGKREGSDLRAGKRTALLAEAATRLDAEGRAAIERAHGNANATDAEVRAATIALERCGARSAVEDRLRALCSQAEAQAEALPFSERARTLFASARSAPRPKRRPRPSPSRSARAPSSPARPSRSCPGEAVISTARGAACGKVILLGEHAVVYGVPALAAGIDRGARAEATLAPSAAASTLTLGGQTIFSDTSSPHDIARAFAALLGEGGPTVTAAAESDLPPGGGLGSSAAIGVALARAIEALRGQDPRAAEDGALARALAWERVFHGNPSGIDTHAAANGGIFRFVRGEPAVPLHVAADLWLAVGLSGSGASTKAMVEGLARLFDRKPDLKTRSVEAIRALVNNAALAIEAGDLEGLGKLMDLNHMILAGLFLSTEPLERLCHLARSNGALGAKLTGSGGGGSVIALLPSPATTDDTPHSIGAAILAAWRDEGFNGFVTRISPVVRP